MVRKREFSRENVDLFKNGTMSLIPCFVFHCTINQRYNSLAAYSFSAREFKIK